MPNQLLNQNVSYWLASPYSMKMKDAGPGRHGKFVYERIIFYWHNEFEVT